MRPADQQSNGPLSMDRLITILRAAHCRSTHQFFVVDAIPLVTTPAGQRLGTQMLRNYKRYLVGAKAPDKDFRDFRNHVLHVQDDHWGGAAKKAEEWYGQLIRKIREGEWSDAAYCAGVLSHYFTDPLMPLHTAQSKKESIVHRPLEWSVTKSYDRILKCYQQGRHKIVFQIARQDGWLSDAVVKGAELSNRYYDFLIDRYDLEVGAKRPEQGFDVESIDVLAGLFGVALNGWARILELAAEESNVEIPEATLSVPELIAGISMPAAWIVRRIASHSEQRAVQALFDEYQATGDVVENLPAEVASVSLERKRDRKLVRDRSRATVKPRVSNSSANIKPIETDATPAETFIRPSSESGTVPFVASQAELTTTVQPSLAMTDDLVDAPSIGPKTAKRFAEIGVTSVEQFLAGDSEKMSQAINTRWIKPETIIDWQDQARLVATVVGLCGYKAQLLVGVECRTASELAAAEAVALHRQIEQFAATSNGKRALRSSAVPSQEDVAIWIENAERFSIKRSA
ncbi:MAG: DUF4332 domain-containing protein [Rubripirellula sp.]